MDVIDWTRLYGDSPFRPYGGTWNPAVKARLEEYRLRIPKYLFRVWKNITGGAHGLNSPLKITPRDFCPDLGGQADTTQSVYNTMTQKLFFEMVHKHLSTHITIKTRFSSWSQSLNFALAYAYTTEALTPRGQNKFSSGVHISIIDT